MSRRRFKIGQHSAYDRHFDNLKRVSQILNPMSNQISWGALQMGDEAGLTSLLARCKAKLEKAENVVAECDRQFEELKATRANTGRGVPTMRESQAQLEYLDALAAADVAGEEVDRIEGMLAKLVEKRKVVEASNVLRCGPVGTGKAAGPGGTLSVLDGQIIKVNGEGILAIDDDRSPYNKMSVVDYKTHLVLPWLATRNRTHAIDKASLPPWPEGVPRPDPPQMEEQPRLRRRR
jgi:hypothetical protein